MPVKKMDITVPLLSNDTWSAMLPPPIFIGPAPKLPAMNRKTINEAMFGALALAIEKASVATLQTLSTNLLP